jgi:hypothetical protein
MSISHPEIHNGFGVMVDVTASGAHVSCTTCSAAIATVGSIIIIIIIIVVVACKEVGSRNGGTRCLE